jgi:uncharacterized phage protein (TIGR01671 family)
MREFKFRMWNKVNNKFISPFRFECDNYYKDTGMVLLDFNGKIRIAEYSKGNGDNSASSVYSEVDNADNYVVQQYTGLTDSKGNRIYEGDIIKEHHFEDWGDKIGYEYIGIVVYKEYSDDILYAGYKTIPAKNQNTKFRGNAIQSDCEVIGNVFENPELLK